MSKMQETNAVETPVSDPVKMTVTTEEVDYCKVKVDYGADPEVVKKTRKQAISNLRAEKVPVPGFRPGKASDLAIKTKYKDRINEWVKNEMLNQANDDVIFETKMRPFHNPNVESSKLSGSKFVCQLMYLTKPEFELKQYNGLEIPAPHMDQTVDEMAEELLNNARKEHGDVQPYDDGDFVQPGDKVTLTYEIPELKIKEEGQLYVVGSNVFPGFDDNLMGMTPNEERKFTTEVKGKQAECSVVLHMGMKVVPCALDDTLAQKCGIKDFDELHSTAKTMATNRYDSIRKNKIGEQLRDRLVEAHDVEPPEWLIEGDAQHIAAQEGVKWSELEEEARKGYLDRGKKSSKFTLILDAIKLDEPEVDVADAEAIEGIKNSLIQRGIPNAEEWLQKSLRGGSLGKMVAQFKNDYALQWLVEHTKVVE